ncbi:MAG: hypothetical protein ACKN9U_08720 [Pirellulaceae bacterium]
MLDIRPIVYPFDPPRSHLVDSLRYWARLTPDAVAYYSPTEKVVRTSKSLSQNWTRRHVPLR